ncbi:hypothetical protein KIN20_021921 [Parelaphostrongylus tenuis]|uniref:Uncharacterized protein n=1 Tax=Parelaphostrongylus tenuis TaxID=148309 RepID=A0AAD5MPY0_PARTN|nr:hypothetical protein KIN20_021921 [Parelaphostrongylus tenuis]
MKLIIALCITLAAAPYQSQLQDNPAQELPAPHIAAYGQHSYDDIFHIISRITIQDSDEVNTTRTDQGITMITHE